MTSGTNADIIINVVASDAPTTRAILENDTERKEDKEEQSDFE